MDGAVSLITKFVTGKTELSDCSRQELLEITMQHPYYAPARLLLLKKLRDEGVIAEPTSAFAPLYFPDVCWLEHLLANPPLAIEKEEEPASEIPVTPSSVPVADAVVPEEKIPVTATEEPLEEVIPVATETDAIPIKFPAFKIEPIDPSKATLSFEPYHTVDYFASQGIKFKEEVKPSNQFDRQLKSFTEWLKVLKNTPATEITGNANAAEEKKVENMAAQSISDRNVETEAMAAVWEKQGNTAKAIAIYQKLSLQNPSKSSYFAAKIDSLKQS